jgi:ketosteroid isomerase-like protein
VWRADLYKEGAMTDEEEIRGLLQDWFASSRSKDLDGLMRGIAPEITSYEHDAPLQYVGRDAVREVCRAGLDASDEVDWDIPDLEVIVRGDIAVTWGLNRMRGKASDGRSFELWSRGTRIFQKRDGRWAMIHQHVSFPYDPASGLAQTELSP